MDSGPVLFRLDLAVEIGSDALELGDHALDLCDFPALLVGLKSLQTNKRLA